MQTATMADVIDADITAPRPEQPLANVQSSPPAPVRAASTITARDLLRLSVERGASLEQIEKLMDLLDRNEARDARLAFVEAMAAFKKEPLDIFKRKQVEFQTRDGEWTRYKHAELSDITDVVGPAMAKYGLSFDWDIHQSNGLITVDCVVTHVQGHFKKVTMSGAPDASGKKNAIQQAASTITYLQRYTLLAATGMSTKGEDDDGAGGADPDGDPGAGQQPAGEAQQNGARSARAAGQNQPARPAFYDQAKFDANKAEWRKVVTSKRKTPAKMIAFIESRGAPLTEAQKNTIDSWSHEND
ncbi:MULTISPECIES: ERF family protein [Burkholderia]|uniref:ERF family protein n=1 Tax=Burkholderia glumae TaxID=337 RepID=A0AAQ0BUN7_BURGL|nr:MULTISPECIES: ERF family protein [Burkholderia]ACR29175.1 ERF family protein [Burkholderia glumae BGR1]AJY65736.1 ERF superfamily protein [Burkholderia glumae LMG 2196 = ATCC 33617]PNL01271.1 single-stranded DNA-binding protein [Burkholderia glumae]QPQ93191.1 ERF family protein [Burkholderia glumae]QQM91606.1 ERF family protein [Burkholderia glumae]